MKFLVPVFVMLVGLAIWSHDTEANGGAAAYYDPSYGPGAWENILRQHAAWGNTVDGWTYNSSGYYCVHPDYRPGQVLWLTANGVTIHCTIGDTVQAAHEWDWRSKWFVELSWNAFIALGLDQNNYVTWAGQVSNVQQPVEPEPEPVVDVFPETGFEIHGAFRDFWHANGGLLIFGYPLSNEVQEDGMTVQYFERAVFEWHPENEDAFKVLLRRVGAEVLSE